MDFLVLDRLGLIFLAAAAEDSTNALENVREDVFQDEPYEVHQECHEEVNRISVGTSVEEVHKWAKESLVALRLTNNFT